MNLFRSEEHALEWELFAKGSEDGILPVEQWFGAFSLPVFANRLDDDYLEKLPGYIEEFFAEAAGMGEGSYWSPPG